MFAVMWRHNQKCPWRLLTDTFPSEKAADAHIAKHSQYDMARRDYAIARLGRVQEKGSFK